MKYGYLRGQKVAEAQDSQVQLMSRFLKDGTVDQWRDSDKPVAPKDDKPAPDTTPAEPAKDEGKAPTEGETSEPTAEAPAKDTPPAEPAQGELSQGEAQSETTGKAPKVKGAGKANEKK